jgi:hypothetical protein
MDHPEDRPRPHLVVAEGRDRRHDRVDLPVDLVDGQVEDLRIAVEGRLEQLVALGHLGELGVVGRLPERLIEERPESERSREVADEAADLLLRPQVVIAPAGRQGDAG